MRKRVFASIVFILLYICCVIITILGYSFLTAQSFDNTVSDVQLCIVLALLTIIFFILILDSLTKVNRKSKHSFFFRFLINFAKLLVVFSAIGATAYVTIFYIPYLHLNDKNRIETLFSKGYAYGSTNGTNFLSRKGDWLGATSVAHSFGDLNGSTYVASYETFYQSYDEGFRAFEADFIFTSDGYVVCRHLWTDSNLQKGISSSNIPTRDVFKSTLMYGQYTPITFTDLCELILNYPDIYIITDTKTLDTDENVSYFTEMVKEAKEAGMEEALDHIVLSVFSKSMLEPILEIYPFKNIIYATYIDWDGNITAFQNYCRWCGNNGVDSISMWSFNYNESVQSIADYYGIDVYVHTVNDADEARNYLAMGARGIYTDSITPEQLEGGW